MTKHTVGEAKRRPHGAEEIRAAVLEVARRRFAAEGSRASLRDIADEAQVNIGLLHRHFGNKAALLGAVLTDVIHRASRDAQPFRSHRDAVDVMLERLSSEDSDSQEYVRILAWMMLGGEDPRDYQTEFSMPSVAELAGAEGRPLLLLVLTSIFGWRVFGSHLGTIVGYTSKSEAANDLTEILRSIVSSVDGSSGASGAAESSTFQPPEGSKRALDN
jgi:TetR/AcrR family transcriptional regulator, repressor for neighboring sulfatase